MKSHQKNQELKNRIWDSLTPKQQKRQEKKAEKSSLQLYEKAKSKGALYIDSIIKTES